MWFEDQQIGKSKSLVCSPLGDELLIYDSASGKVHVLNGTAHQVWKWLDSGMRIEEIADHICTVYDGVSMETAQQDVRQMLRRFVESAIVVVQPQEQTVGIPA